MNKFPVQWQCSDREHCTRKKVLKKKHHIYYIVNTNVCLIMNNRLLGCMWSTKHAAARNKQGNSSRLREMSWNIAQRSSAVTVQWQRSLCKEKDAAENNWQVRRVTCVLCLVNTFQADELSKSSAVYAEQRLLPFVVIVFDMCFEKFWCAQ